MKTKNYKNYYNIEEEAELPLIKNKNRNMQLKNVW